MALKNELTLQERQEMQAQVDRIKSQISFDNQAIATYGSDVSKKLTDFSTEILKSTKLKDSPEVEELLLSLVGELNAIDCTSLTQKKKGFLARLLGDKDPKQFIAKYESAHAFVTSVKNELSKAEFTLNKSIKTCEEYLRQNFIYINELDLYIEAGNQKIAEEEAKIEQMKLELAEDDLLAAQEVSLAESELKQFKRKIHNMNIQRTVAIQNIPQLMLIKDGDAVLVEKINSSIETSIPLWETQMAIAMEIAKQENGAKLVKAITDTNNELLKRNSELLKQSTTAVAVELERDIVDLETLKKTNDDLIATIQEIRRIREDGEKNREAAALEMRNLNDKLVASVTDVEKPALSTSSTSGTGFSRLGIGRRH